MERETMMELMKDIYTSSEAACYLGMTSQHFDQLVYDHQIEPIKISQSESFFYKDDLDQLKVLHKRKQNGSFEINNTFVRDAILYYTIQQYFHHNDQRTSKFIDLIKREYHFDEHAGLKNNIPFLAHLLKVTEKEFYDCYLMVKHSFLTLPKDVVLVKKGDLNYSRLLELTNIAPPYLFCRGDVTLLKEKPVCVVGSRNASHEGMMKTKHLVKSLATKNIVVAAGLAKGIDTMTHQTTLENHGRTIAVLGTPIDQYYPKENRALQDEIIKKGLVVSQFPPCNQVERWNFPTRNGVMSGLSIGTIIMEAGEKSGALKQADYALKQGRDVLIPFSLAQDPSLKWPSQYIKKGARPFESWLDLVEFFNHNRLFHNILYDRDVSVMEAVDILL